MVQTRGSVARATAVSAASSLSWMDRLQKDAQASELEPANTHPLVFVALGLVQFPVGWYVSRALGVPDLEWVAMLAMGMHFAGFVVSQLIGSCFMFDLTGEITFTVCMVYNYASIPSSPSSSSSSSFYTASPRQMICTGLSLVWCFRLGYFLFARILKRGADWRFDKLITEPCYNFFAWISQGKTVTDFCSCCCCCCCFPFFLLHVLPFVRIFTFDSSLSLSS